MSFIGLHYIFAKHDKFMYLLSTTDGEVIEQMFHVSHLKRGLLRLPNGKSVKNINNYKLERIRLKIIETPLCIPNGPDTSQTCVKTVFHSHNDSNAHNCQNSNNCDISFQSPSLVQNSILDRRNNLLHSYHAHHCMLPSADALKDTVFSPDESL